MATATVSRTDTRTFTAWFADFLKSELAPYPGRTMMVGRMVIAATITMILIMTFRIPGGATGPLYAFLISRENLGSTAKSSFYLLIALALTTVFVPIGARMFASTAETHFFWEAASLFLIFFLIRTLTNYSIASAIGLIGTSAIATWYLTGPAELNVERTLWQILSPAVGAAVTIVVEAVFHAFHSEDELITGLRVRLDAMQQLLVCYSAHVPVSSEVERKLTQYAMVGVGGLRRQLTRSNYQPLYRAQMQAVVSLVGRSIDFAAALIHAHPQISAADSQLASSLVQQLAEIQKCLLTHCSPSLTEVTSPSGATSLLREMEQMVALIPRVIEGTASIESFRILAHEPVSEAPILVRDAFTNPEHLRFALSGCVAGMLCYILYVSLAWPGLSTSVTTCVLTALSTVGASRQKQILRIAGAVIGGFIFGLGAQIFVLPYIDSITGFTLLFAGVSIVAAWIGTASARLSYCGLQIALAFYLIHVNDFTIQLSLSIARDRALGVLLGIAMMWLVFDRLQPTSATGEMVGTFSKNLRLLAELTLLNAREHSAASIITIRGLRDRIATNFATVNAQADAVPFELGALRNQHMAARDRIRRWQATLRTFYMLELALLQYRAFATAEKPSAETVAWLEDFDQSAARALVQMADYLDMQNSQEIRPHLEIERPTPISGPDAAVRNSSLSMANELASILARLRDEMLATPLFAPE